MNLPGQRSEAAMRIKNVAMRLYAEHGVDGVTVREIAAAAGQKNHGAVGYHFGSKEALVREIVADGARIIDERRLAMLGAIEARAKPATIADLVDAIIYPSIDPFEAGERDCYQRFIVILTLTHRDLFTSAIGNRWNRGYQRCLSQIRKLMPDEMPASVKNQRLMFVGSYAAMMLALRQTSLSDTTREHSTWSSDETLRHIAHTACAIIEAPDMASVPTSPIFDPRQPGAAMV